MFGGASLPSPSPTATEPDPFNPDVTIWPDAPGWLFPTVMVFTGLVVAAVVVLLVMWRKSVSVQRAEREAKGPTQWVDLSKLDKKGRWEDDE
jgi:hypothetical protein